jgi:hypothetical protein
VYSVLGIAVNVWAKIRTTWIDLLGFMQDKFGFFTKGIEKGWTTMGTVAEEIFYRIFTSIDGVSQDLVQEGVDNIWARADQKLSEIDKYYAMSPEEREAGRQAERDRIEKERQQDEASLNEALYNEIADREKAYDGQIKESQDSLDATRKQWKASIEEAKRKRAEAEGAPKKEPERPEMPPLPEITAPETDKLAEVADTLDTVAERTIEVQGTFSAQAVAGMGAGSSMDRTAKATEETAKNTKKLLDEAQNGGLVFA